MSEKKLKVVARYTLDKTSREAIELALSPDALDALKRMVDFATESNRLGAQYLRPATLTEITVQVAQAKRNPAKAPKARVVSR